MKMNGKKENENDELGWENEGGATKIPQSQKKEESQKNEKNNGEEDSERLKNLKEFKDLEEFYDPPGGES